MPSLPKTINRTVLAFTLLGVLGINMPRDLEAQAANLDYQQSNLIRVGEAPAIHHVSFRQNSNGFVQLYEDGVQQTRDQFGRMPVLHSDRSRDTVFVVDGGSFNAARAGKRMGFALAGNPDHNTTLDLTSVAQEFGHKWDVTTQSQILVVGSFGVRMKHVDDIKIGPNKIPVSYDIYQNIEPRVGSDVKQTLIEAKGNDLASILPSSNTGPSLRKLEA